ncbi:MAG TPA: PDZ domain-containing protein [Sphingobacterium sp.]|nr:PDZ domain-containing protein [Sphingobacterium sp.]
MMKVLIGLLFVCLSPVIHAQGIFRLYEHKPRSFKFEMINNTVLVPVVINGMEFTFLLDTGVKETILFALAQDTLYLRNQNKITFRGLGIGDDIEAILSTGNVMEVGDVAIDTLHWIYVIQANDLDIASDIGTAVNGILGAKFFNSFSVKIDYQKSKITLYPPGYNYDKEHRGYHVTRLQIENERPYIQAKVQVDKDWTKGKFLVDMGNTDPLMLFSFVLPNFTVASPYVYEYLGRGINGPIHGKRNRVRRLDIGNFELAYPIVSYPDSNTVTKDRLTKNRIGSIGNQTLQRFYLLFDYANERIYWKKNKWFRKPFSLNMAGMDVKHDGMIWVRELAPTTGKKNEKPHLRGRDEGITIHFSNDNFQYNFVLKPQYKISGIRKDSPAERAGVRPGDQLLKINGTIVQNLSLAKIMAKLQSHPNDEIRLELQRKDEIIKIRFQLEDPIPYL